MRMSGVLLTIILMSLLVLSASAETDNEAFMAAYSSYQELHEQGATAKSLPFARLAYELGEKVFAEDSENLAALTDNYGVNLLHLRKYDEAKPILAKTLRRFENQYGKKSEKLIPVLMDLANASATIGNARPQRSLYSRVLKLAKDHYGKDSVAYGRLSMRAGVAIMDRARTVAAKSYLKNSYNIFSKELGPDDPLTGLSAFYLGKYEMKTGDHRDAKEYLLAALSTFEDPDSPSSSIEMITHAFLVETYEELGNTEEATKHCLVIGSMSPQRGEQDFIPLFRKTPKYPVSALNRGLDGNIVLKFTVDAQGFVEDVETVEVNGDHIFVKPAVEAVMKFRYAPAFVDGEPVATPDVHLRLKFEMAE